MRGVARPEGFSVCLFAFLWFLSGAVIGASIRGAKGYSAVAGFIGGSVMGPLALLCLLDEPKVEKRCSHCKEPINRDATTCPHCRRPLDKPKGMRNCPFCLESIKRNANVCRFCRQQVPPVSPAAPD